MKKIYIEAELEVIDLLNADIITASGANNDPFSGSGDHDVDFGGDEPW